MQRGPGEIPELRTATSRTIKKADGTFTTTLFGHAIHYRGARFLDDGPAAPGWRPRDRARRRRAPPGSSRVLAADVAHVARHALLGDVAVEVVERVEVGDDGPGRPCWRPAVCTRSSPSLGDQVGTRGTAVLLDAPKRPGEDVS